MPFKDLLKKKEKIESTDAVLTETAVLPKASEFTFMRTDTNTQELIQPPRFDSDDRLDAPAQASTTPKRFSRFRKGSTSQSEQSASPPAKEHKRLSQRLHLSGSGHSRSNSSINLPDNLPEVPNAYSVEGDVQEKEAIWEERATLLASQRPLSSAGTPAAIVGQLGPASTTDASGRSRSPSDAASDVNIQEAIRLHETGELERATKMFYQLAEQGNVLSQVLYGLSLRHGWGCQTDPERAVQYLSAAASNSAAVETEALKAGMKKGGAAKGELVLAIFELANCYRNGWGVTVDKVAARQYYETAANLGDTDAMEQAAWCYLEGFGGKKDKVSYCLFVFCVHAICFEVTFPFFPTRSYAYLNEDTCSTCAPVVVQMQSWLRSPSKLSDSSKSLRVSTVTYDRLRLQAEHRAPVPMSDVSCRNHLLHSVVRCNSDLFGDTTQVTNPIIIVIVICFATTSKMM